MRTHFLALSVFAVLSLASQSIPMPSLSSTGVAVAEEMSGGWRPKRLGLCVAVLALTTLAAASAGPQGVVVGAAMVPLVMEACS